MDASCNHQCFGAGPAAGRPDGRPARNVNRSELRRRALHARGAGAHGLLHLLRRLREDVDLVELRDGVVDDLLPLGRGDGEVGLGAVLREEREGEEAARAAMRTTSSGPIFMERW